ncbi:hypothetical protein AN216_13530 [Streptomyces oceani]|uniref:Abortive infection protein n=1 Tax=Streptomyces oceani TaxID=1075402 RepID=A0A1E7KGH4_9ACTN|nr:hypothetical protein AN216_13530 [Streptomyces oceani]
MRRDMSAIRDDLACNAVSIMGTDPQRLLEAARIAVDKGLFAWLQPRMIEARPRAIESGLRALCAGAQKLQGHGAVGINIGCELTLTSRGIVPGRSFDHRGQRLPKLIMSRKRKFDRKLNSLLARLAAAVRESFTGPITYSAGDWESVDWSPFDYVGLDTYRDEDNAADYARQVSRHTAGEKPVLVTEFGCCAYRGAAERGASGYDILDHQTDPPSITSEVVRDEQVQADYLSESINALATTGVHGVFVFAFSEPMHLHSDEVRTDADLASFGIVKITHLAGASAGEAEQWLPKSAFQAVASRYTALHG